MNKYPPGVFVVDSGCGFFGYKLRVCGRVVCGFFGYKNGWRVCGRVVCVFLKTAGVFVEKRLAVCVAHCNKPHGFCGRKAT